MQATWLLVLKCRDKIVLCYGFRGFVLGSFYQKHINLLQKPVLEGYHAAKKTKQEIILRSFLVQILIFIASVIKNSAVMDNVNPLPNNQSRSAVESSQFDNKVYFIAVIAFAIAAIFLFLALRRKSGKANE